jgi:hypothetical protein
MFALIVSRIVVAVRFVREVVAEALAMRDAVARRYPGALNDG